MTFSFRTRSRRPGSPREGGRIPQGSTSDVPTKVTADRAPFRVLVVEDEYIIASNICLELEAEGFQVVGPAGTLDHAFALAATADNLGAAVLDVNIGGFPVFGVADILSSRGVPFLLASGYDRTLMPDRHQTVVQFEKPLVLREIIAALHRIAGRQG